jgi:surface polysaccharide O-acyltransferase-like enzyme
MTGVSAASPGEGISGRWVWADLVRVSALFAVVLLHTAAVPATRFGQLPADWWWAANLLDAAVRPCVPLFVMVSGALLLGVRKQETVSYFVRRRLAKVVIPLLAWSAAYACWRIFFHGQSMTLAEFGWHLVKGMGDPVYPHLWFLFLIASLYLVTPVFRVYVANASTGNLLYFSGLWFLATAVRPVVERMTGVVIGLSLEPVTGFIGYFVLGAALLRAYPGRLCSRARFAYGTCWIVAYAITAIGTWRMTERAGALDETLYFYLSPNVIVMSVAAYLLLREAGRWIEARGPDSAAVRGLALASALGLGAYVIHAAMLDLLEAGSFGIALGATRFHPALAAPLSAAAAFSLSLLLTAVLQRIPGVRALVP